MSKVEHRSQCCHRANCYFCFVKKEGLEYNSKVSPAPETSQIPPVNFDDASNATRALQLSEIELSSIPRARIEAFEPRRRQAYLPSKIGVGVNSSKVEQTWLRPTPAKDPLSNGYEALTTDSINSEEIYKPLELSTATGEIHRTELLKCKNANYDRVNTDATIIPEKLKLNSSNLNLSLIGSGLTSVLNQGPPEDDQRGYKITSKRFLEPTPVDTAVKHGVDSSALAKTAKTTIQLNRTINEPSRFTPISTIVEEQNREVIIDIEGQDSSENKCSTCQGFYCKTCNSNIPPEYRPSKVTIPDPQIMAYYTNNVYNRSCETCLGHNQDSKLIYAKKR